MLSVSVLRRQVASATNNSKVAATTAASSLKSFWQVESRPTTAHDVIAKHAAAQQQDRNLKWTARRNALEAGVSSNLFPLKIDPSKLLYKYSIEVVRSPRRAPPPSSSPTSPTSSNSPVASSDPNSTEAQQQQQQQQQLQQQQQQNYNRTPPPVSPTRAWRMFAQSLRQIPQLPPVLRVGNSIFSAGPIPESALVLDKKYHDAGWEACKLVLEDTAPLSALGPDDLKQVANKMLPWALSYHARQPGAASAGFSVVREVDSKLITTEDSIAVSGLRIFRGTTAAILQITNPNLGGNLLSGGGINNNNNNTVGQNNNNNMMMQQQRIPRSQALANLNMSTPPNEVLRVFVSSRLRQFQFQGRSIQVFQVKDSSGATNLTMWDQRSGGDNLTPGAVVEIEGFKVKAADPRFKRDTDADFELQGTSMTTIRLVPEEEILQEQQQQQQDSATAAAAGGGGGNSESVENNNNNNNDSSSSSDAVFPTFYSDATTLALRLDTRCTVASEKSLLCEITQHFGAGPWDEQQQKRIARAVQGTPVVLASNLRHSVVRHVRFDINIDEAPMDPSLRKMAPDMQKHQPLAVVHDFSLVPLQLLHCASDPRSRGWAAVSAPACSFMPRDRVQILAKFRAALTKGLAQFGVTLLDEAYKSKDISIFEKPQLQTPATSSSYGNNRYGSSGGNQQQQQQQQRVERPRLVSIVAIRSKHSTPEELQASEKTSTSLARHFATPHSSMVDGEAQALAHLRKTLCVPASSSSTSTSSSSSPSFASGNGEMEQLRDPNCVAIILSTDRDSRASRWLTSECLRRGILPYFMQGINNEKRLRLLNVQTTSNMASKFSSVPFPASMNIQREVPSLQGKNVLMIGVDACHSNSCTTGSCVGFVLTSSGRSFVVPRFWQTEVRGMELENLTRNFGNVVEEARQKCDNQVLHEVIVYQDGNVYAELDSMQQTIPAGANLTFSCLHKRTHVRFTFHDSATNRDGNVTKGSVVRALTPQNNMNNNNNNNSGDASSSSSPLDLAAAAAGAAGPGGDVLTPSFFMTCHECFTSTARTVQFVVHRTSPNLPLSDFQKLTFSLAHIGSPQSTKLPLPCRSAHRLSAQVERLIDASPAFRNVVIPAPLAHRCWFL